MYLDGQLQTPFSDEKNNPPFSTIWKLASSESSSKRRTNRITDTGSLRLKNIGIHLPHKI
jgi:hypothetical protein